MIERDFAEMAGEVRELLQDVSIRGALAERMVVVKQMLRDLAEGRVIVVAAGELPIPAEVADHAAGTS
jgi:hypothetical protein